MGSLNIGCRAQQVRKGI